MNANSIAQQVACPTVLSIAGQAVLTPFPQASVLINKQELTDLRRRAAYWECFASVGIGQLPS